MGHPAGTIELAIPKLRHGSYYPEWLLKRRRRAKRALAPVTGWRVMRDNGVVPFPPLQSVEEIKPLFAAGVPQDGPGKDRRLGWASQLAELMVRVAELRGRQARPVFRMITCHGLPGSGWFLGPG
jgi:hypothetical protein